MLDQTTPTEGQGEWANEQRKKVRHRNGEKKEQQKALSPLGADVMTSLIEITKRLCRLNLGTHK